MSTAYNAEQQAKELYLKTDLSDVAAVEAAIASISADSQLSNKGRYLEALRSANPATIAKARKYHNMSTSPIKKNFGWIVMGLFAVLMAVVDSDFEDSITTWISLGFWIGVGIQIYIAVLKNAWSKLTLTGLAMHSAVTGYSATASTTPVTPTTNAAEKGHFCDQCGTKNECGTQFCTECGNKLN